VSALVLLILKQQKTPGWVVLKVEGKTRTYLASPDEVARLQLIIEHDELQTLVRNTG
jgi:hypothetical protein